MNFQLLSFVLDILVLIGLGVTVFYALKLSKSLNGFRQHRQEMNKLIEELSKNIDEALRAIDGLKLAGERSGRDLQKIINESRAMADELQLVNESSNSLANRLESLAEKNRMIAQGFEEPGEYASAPESARNITNEKPAFAIYDRDFGASAEEKDEDFAGNLQSQAEKELFQALQKNKKSSSRGAF